MNQHLKKILDRAEAATEGPWRSEVTPMGPCGQMIYADAVLAYVDVPTSKPDVKARYEIPILMPERREVSPKKWRANVHFASCARTDVPLLCNLLNEALEALEFYADRKNWEKIEGHTKWASNLNSQDCAMLNCGGGRARLALAAYKALGEK